MNIAKVNGSALTSQEFVSWLKLTGRFNSVASDLIKCRLASAAARAQGIQTSLEEMQAASDDHRRAHGLFRATDASEFLDKAQVKFDDYERFIEDMVLATKMYETVASEAAVEEYFSLNKPNYDAIDIGHIAVPRESQAREILALLQEEPGSFAELAREQSVAETAAEGGRIGRIYRGALSPEVEAKLFSATIGEPLGPFNAGDDLYEVYTVFARHDASLEPATSEMIKKQLYDRWLETAARTYGVEA